MKTERVGLVSRKETSMLAATLLAVAGCGAGNVSSEGSRFGLGWRTASVVEARGDENLALSDGAVLSRELLIEAVLRRNPTVEVARQAWAQALARFPQVTSYADPFLSYEGAPASLGTEEGYGQSVRVTQRFEWPGKRELRGVIARAEADARESDLQTVRLHLRTAASILFDDYFAVGQALATNQAHHAIVTRLRQSAEAQYAAGRVGQQDPVQADVELALLSRERLALQLRKQVIIAQINELLHRPASAALPAAPETLESATESMWTAAQWQRYAQIHRPELRSAVERIEAREHDIALAEREYFPDVTVALGYSSMRPQLERQFTFGLSLSVPLQSDARRAGVEEATAALARAESTHAERQSAVNVEVWQSLVRFNEALERVTLYHEQIVPAARRQIQAAESGYTSGRNSFSDIMRAERQLRQFEHDYAEAVADTWRRRATLTRAVGVASLEAVERGRP